jgi:signal transduction histidine kinase
VHSIRLSLTVYFLVLLAAALGGASWVVYETAADTLRDKRKATAELIQSQHEERCREACDQVDKALLSQAQSLTRLTQFQLQFDLNRVRWLNEIGLLTAGLTPSGAAAIPVWAVASQRGPVSFELYRRFLTGIRLNQDDLVHHSEGVTADHRAEGQAADYFQIDSSWGASYRSPSLGARYLPTDPIMTTVDPGMPEFDDVQLEPGLSVRRVMLKTSMVRLGPPLPPPGERSSSESRRRREGRLEFISRPTLYLYVQCACGVERREAALLDIGHTRDAELEQLDQTTEDSQAGLRKRLFAVAIVTFLAGIPGCVALVHFGLAPLRRLSDAVSRVSAKDFHLPFAGPKPPRELQPIVARLREALDMLKRAFAREKQATADISHELRTPLAALLTTTEMALRRQRSPEEYQEVLVDCQASARQMSRAVERLLALARLDAGVDTLRLKAVDASVLAEQCLSVVRPLAHARGVRLAVHVHGEQIPQLTTDPDKFSEVLTNLLHNAIQYNRPGGDIDVQLGRHDGRFELAVRDTGVGIAPEARAHLFERFWRADPSRGADGLHAGLGLAIVKGYVDLMGGTITVESNEGKGSTFRVELPV